MKVEFRRTGERRYAVKIYREGERPREMNPAPGFDPLMPHDLLHMIVERELGLSRGVFGQLASGGDAGTFRRVSSQIESTREAARERRRAGRRGARLSREGREEAALSELATDVCLREWLRRDKGRRTMAAQKSGPVDGALPAHRIPEHPRLSREMISRICERMDELSVRWAKLGIDEAMILDWPDQRR